MKQFIIILFASFISANPVFAQESKLKAAEEEIIELEKTFADLIKSRDMEKVQKLQSENYFLAVAVQGNPLVIIPKNEWLKTLKNYIVESHSFDDIKVNVYGNTAVALILFTQKATTGGRDRSAQFLLTDIWVKQANGWVIAERHSSRPEVMPGK